MLYLFFLMFVAAYLLSSQERPKIMLANHILSNSISCIYHSMKYFEYRLLGKTEGHTNLL